MGANLQHCFIESALKNKDRQALDCHDGSLSYKELLSKAIALSDSFDASGVSRIGILGNREILSYVTLYSAVISLRTFVPLNQRFPVKKLVYIIEKSDIDAIYVASCCTDLFIKVLGQVKRQIKVFTDSKDSAAKFSNLSENIEITVTDDIVNDSTDKISIENAAFRLMQKKPCTDLPLYIIFTSGTTGDPKGVEVSFDNMSAYLNAVVPMFGYKCDDRIAQVSDITFDLAQGEIFIAFTVSACLAVVYPKYLFAFASFLKDKNISCVTLVPSAVLLLHKMRLLDNLCLEKLRLTNFLGEALPYSTASIWKECSTNSLLYNIYGPTETTVSITYFKIDDTDRSGIVPIGAVFEGSYFLLIDENGQITQNEGEICLGGPQVCNGYYKNESKNAASFFMHNGIRYYKTGDMGALEIIDGSKVLIYKGRMDDELKVQGFRVSLLEIDEAFVSAFKTLGAAVALKDENEGSVKIILAVNGDDNCIDRKDILNALKEILPFYMLPSAIVYVGSMPYNSNGKLDRKALTEMIKELEI